MKKVILGTSLIVILVLGVGVYYVFTNLDAIVKAAIEKHGSAATQTAVRVDSLHIELTDGAGTINDLSIASPTGFSTALAFSLGEIHTKIDLSSLKEEPYIIDEIRIIAPQVFFEINSDRKTNLNQLKKNLSKGAAKPKPTQASEQGTAKEPRLIIKRILFTDGEIKALVAPLNNKEYQLKLPTIAMNNLGGKKGATPTELTKEIIDRLIDQTKKALKKSQYGQELDRLKGEAKAKLAEEKAKQKKEIDEKLDIEKQKAKDKIKGLFGN